jgi:hypothetical protein
MANRKFAWLDSRKCRCVLCGVELTDSDGCIIVHQKVYEKYVDSYFCSYAHYADHYGRSDVGETLSGTRLRVHPAQNSKNSPKTDEDEEKQ